MSFLQESVGRETRKSIVLDVVLVRGEVLPEGNKRKTTHTLQRLC